MDTVLAAVIGGAFSMAGTLIAIYHKEIAYLFRRSRRDVTGSWHGHGTDIVVPGHLEYDSLLKYEYRGELRQRGSRVVFDGTSDADHAYHVVARGWIKGDYVFAITQSDEKGVNDFGVAILHYLGTGLDLKGYYLGKRLREDGLVLIRIELKRVT